MGQLQALSDGLLVPHCWDAICVSEDKKDKAIFRSQHKNRSSYINNNREISVLTNKAVLVLQR